MIINISKYSVNYVIIGGIGLVLAVLVTVNY